VKGGKLRLGGDSGLDDLTAASLGGSVKNLLGGPAGGIS